MNNDQLEGSMKQMMGKAREKWGDLTDDEIQQTKGEREQMVGLLQRKYGKTKADAEREFDEFMASH
ncbi:CsbD family protein [Amaricoccus macauensis]|uniref:CsbD family protein n=1 Tax=Amaricoccus macauensis TaxID=57001 RepID=UPI003C7A069C